ncbi:hypothetical protein B0H14DRAFT_3501917 [Mycena olivaceomarginata]|nr:hypothetical protein B0H14DRAFT_3501917 [Mycena olivaceomarginata]
MPRGQPRLDPNVKTQNLAESRKRYGEKRKYLCQAASNSERYAIGSMHRSARKQRAADAVIKKARTRKKVELHKKTQALPKSPPPVAKPPPKLLPTVAKPPHRRRAPSPITPTPVSNAHATVGEQDNRSMDDESDEEHPERCQSGQHARTALSAALTVIRRTAWPDPGHEDRWDHPGPFMWWFLRRRSGGESSLQARSRADEAELWTMDCNEYHNHEGEQPAPEGQNTLRDAGIQCPFFSIHSHRIHHLVSALPSPSSAPPTKMSKEELAYLASSRPPPGPISKNRLTQQFARILGPQAVAPFVLPRTREEPRTTSPAGSAPTQPSPHPKSRRLPTRGLSSRHARVIPLPDRTTLWRKIDAGARGSTLVLYAISGRNRGSKTGAVPWRLAGHPGADLLFTRNEDELQQEELIETLVLRYGRTEEYIRKVVCNGAKYGNRRGVNTKNAIMHEYCNRARDEGGPSNMHDVQGNMTADEYQKIKDSFTEEELMCLKDQLAEHRKVKQHGPQATNKACQQDTVQTCNRVGKLRNLHQRTVVSGIALFTCGTTNLLAQLNYNPLERHCPCPSASLRFRLIPCPPSFVQLPTPPNPNFMSEFEGGKPAGLDHPNPDFMSEFEGGTTRGLDHPLTTVHATTPRPSSPSCPSSCLHSLSFFHDLVLDHDGIRYPDVSSMYPLLLPKDRAEEEGHKLSLGMHILVDAPTGWPRPSPPDGVLLRCEVSERAMHCSSPHGPCEPSARMTDELGRTRRIFHNGILRYRKQLPSETNALPISQTPSCLSNSLPRHRQQGTMVLRLYSHLLPTTQGLYTSPTVETDALLDMDDTQRVADPFCSRFRTTSRAGRTLPVPDADPADEADLIPARLLLRFTRRID